jgi:hypothetical protein
MVNYKERWKMILGTHNRYQSDYNDLIEKQVRGMIGSQRFGPTYVKKFINYYEICPPDTRKFLRGFIYIKLQECENRIKIEKDSEVKEKLEKKLKLYETLFTGVSMMKSII